MSVSQATKIFLTGGDRAGWALDAEIKQLKKFFEKLGVYEVVSTPEASDIIYSVWWVYLYEIPLDILKEKYVICHISNRPFQYFKEPSFTVILPYIDHLVSQTTEAKKEFESVGIKSDLFPYTVDTHLFKIHSQEEKRALRKKYQIPEDVYVLGNFHRDTEGSNLKKVKSQKGADIFLEMLKILWAQNKKIHVLLAGPRRHWLRNQLEKFQIPYTFIGVKKRGDDWPVNILTQKKIGELYQILNLAVVSSRWEGGPRTILEAAASKIKLVSSPVGLAKDLLEEQCLFNNFVEGAAIIEKDMDTCFLDDTLSIHYERVQSQHSIQGSLGKFQRMLFSIKEKPSKNKSSLNDQLFPYMYNRDKRKSSVSIWHQYKRPPYGGGNQFMLALTKNLKKRGIKIHKNRINKKIKTSLINSVHFDQKVFQEKIPHQQRVGIHRIDGPIQKYRGTDQGLDQLCFELNQEHAYFTVLQSNYVFRANTELGFHYTNPIILHNAVDPKIFNRKVKKRFSKKRKTRLIAASWSSNKNKGSDIYKWLEDYLNWDKYTFTFLGNTATPFNKIQTLPPVPSKAVAGILKQHDIFITASQLDPCSNVLIEALSCGLPAVYRKSGGHSELVGWGGLGFENPEEIPALLDQVVEHYEGFQNLIAVNTMEHVGSKYEEMIHILESVS